VEINGVAHVVLRVNRFEECIRFYDRLMPALGLDAVHRDDGFVYYIGGRTALAIRRVDPGCADHPHLEGRVYGRLATTRCPSVIQRESAWRSTTFQARACSPQTPRLTRRPVTR
jgi:catechol 2,3-dioxygenase-like lactoylglutathione lyase family enzyme